MDHQVELSVVLLSSRILCLPTSIRMECPYSHVCQTDRMVRVTKIVDSREVIMQKEMKEMDQNHTRMTILT